MFDLIKELLSLKKSIEEKKNVITNLQQQIDKLENDKIIQRKQLDEYIKATERDKNKVINELDEAKKNKDDYLKTVEKERISIIEKYQDRTENAKHICEQEENRKSELLTENNKYEKKLTVLQEKLKTYRKLCKNASLSLESGKIESSFESQLDLLTPTVEIHLHTHDVKTLRELSKENNKIIEETLSRFENRYTTKTNKTIYQLMVIALRSELQNILIDLKFSNIEQCKENLKNIINKYSQIAADGNQVISGTLLAFIKDIEFLFSKSIDIEYEYYVKKEQEKAEQQALREQMQQEKEERRILEEQKKQLEKEELKYTTEIEKITEQLTECQEESKIKALNDRILELNKMLEKALEQKEEIIKRQNGKAGYVYIISNLGSFGENKFKVGMTRRLEPMDRIKELGDASVPFAFDIHSFIFSDNAVDLEKTLHSRLHKQRTNKINFRKEFFNVTVDELEKLVHEIDPTAEFNKTMAALEYRQSQKIEL